MTGRCSIQPGSTSDSSVKGVGSGSLAVDAQRSACERRSASQVGRRESADRSVFMRGWAVFIADAVGSVI